MSKVRIPPVLRAMVDNSKQVDVDGTTVGEVLQGLVRRYPGLHDQLLGADESLNRFVNVYLNDQDVRYLDELATPLQPGDTVVILPAMAGGSGSGDVRGAGAPAGPAAAGGA